MVRVCFVCSGGDPAAAAAAASPRPADADATVFLKESKELTLCLLLKRARTPRAMANIVLGFNIITTTK